MWINGHYPKIMVSFHKKYNGITPQQHFYHLKATMRHHCDIIWWLITMQWSQWLKKWQSHESHNYEFTGHSAQSNHHSDFSVKISCNNLLRVIKRRMKDANTIFYFAVVTVTPVAMRGMKEISDRLDFP